MSDAGSDPALEAALVTLRRQYRERLPEKQAIFAAALAPLEAKAASAAEMAEAVATLRFHAHKLSGSAATYGFAVLGEAARKLEETCDAALSGADSVDIVALTTVCETARALLAQPEFQ